MTSLTPSTRRRLKQIRQVPSVWEGDRRPLMGGVSTALDVESEMQGDCILWVDGVEETVRAMEIVPPDVGPEAVVRSLLRAMESPHGGGLKPARPQRIVVGDRETQFYLRGVLQDLEITVDYAPELPLIDEIFRGLQEVANNRPPQLPPDRADALIKTAHEIWQDAPWEVLDEEKILAIELNSGDVETLYISVLGMLGMEFGILMYRSLDSLRQFRERVLASEDEPEILERAFLEQDCFFLTFDQEEIDFSTNGTSPDAEIQPTFGNLHPLEGMRPVLYEEEAIAVQVALTALHRFFQQHLQALDIEHFPEVTGRYRIPDPTDLRKKLSVQVKTMPAIAAELAGLDEDDLDDDFDATPILRDDLIPPESFYSLGALPMGVLEVLRAVAKVHQPSTVDLPKKVEEYPVILIQTSRPKATKLIEAIQQAGGIEAICFNPGEDVIAEVQYDLGILKLKNGDLHLFGEFKDDDPVHIQARKKWDQRCKKTKGQCGLVIAKGLTGNSRGNPNINDMVALFEAKAFFETDLGLGPLELVRQLEGF